MFVSNQLTEQCVTLCACAQHAVSVIIAQEVLTAQCLLVVVGTFVHSAVESLVYCLVLGLVTNTSLPAPGFAFGLIASAYKTPVPSRIGFLVRLVLTFPAKYETYSTYVTLRNARRLTLAQYETTTNTLLGYYATSSGSFVRTFRDNLLVPSSRVKKSFLTLEDGTDSVLRNVGKGLPLDAA